MRTSLLLSALGATAATAAPTYPKLNVNAVNPESVHDLSAYFSLLAEKISQGKKMATAPVCDLSNAVLPVDTPTALPPVTEGLVLKHVAVGRGTQNYTCAAATSAAMPAAVGAVATLFNASCIAAAFPDLLALLPRAALAFNLTTTTTTTTDDDDDAAAAAAADAQHLAPGNYMVSGHHYFRGAATPYFDLDTARWRLGAAPCTKAAAAPAPAGAAAGPRGEPAVAWLKLTTGAAAGATGRLREVYRVATAGGAPPATCAGMAAAFEVQYSAVYWFYEST